MMMMKIKEKKTFIDVRVGEICIMTVGNASMQKGLEEEMRCRSAIRLVESLVLLLHAQHVVCLLSKKPATGRHFRPIINDWHYFKQVMKLISSFDRLLVFSRYGAQAHRAGYTYSVCAR